MRLLFKPERAVAEAPEPETPPEPERAPEPEPGPVPPEIEREAFPPVEPEPIARPEVQEAASGPDAAKVLASALESLGQAHHRPFSRG
jgi:hypothetical protein